MKPGKNWEIQLTDAILDMKNNGGKLYTYDYQRLRYDTGDKFGMFIANVEFGLECVWKLKIYAILTLFWFYKLNKLR